VEKNNYLKKMLKSCINRITVPLRILYYRIFCGSCLDHLLNAVSCVMRLLGPCLIVFAIGLISSVAYTYLRYILPKNSTIPKLLNGAFGIFLYTQILYNYVTAVKTDGGRPPDYESIIESGQAVGQKSYDEDSGDYYSDSDDECHRPEGKKIRQCHKCKLSKPERAHHCSICKRCILKMDHHCPWINNCVGVMNYRYFCLFMWYLIIGCIFIIVHMYDDFYQCMYFPRKSGFDFDTRQKITMSFVMACAIGIALCILGGFHAFLVATNQTTIEFQMNWTMVADAKLNGDIFRNPYDVGRSNNFQEVFGKSPFFTFTWMLPTFEHIGGDGMSYPNLYTMKV